MFNVILLNSDKSPSEDMIRSAIGSVVGETRYSMEYKNGSAMITISDKNYSCLYIDKEMSLEMESDIYAHKAHMIISSLDVPKNIREGISIQQGVLRLVLMLMLEMGEQWIYWSNSRRVCDINELHGFLENYNRLVGGDKKSPSSVLPLSYWIAVDKGNRSIVKIVGLDGLGEQNINIPISGEINRILEPLLQYLIMYIFDKGVGFKSKDIVQLIEGKNFEFYEHNGNLFLRRSRMTLKEKFIQWVYVR